MAHTAAAQPAINAQPQGGKVVAGSATIGQTATLTQINQSSQRAAVNWSSFDVGSAQQVQFQQPSASAMTLNRVTGPDPSQIAGQITANGQIVLVNPAGVLFTKGAQVEAQSVIVSAAGISNQNFMAGRMAFDQSARPDAAVVNQGRITVKQTGLAALVAPRVENDGMISAKLGRVVLGGAETATLDLYGDGLLSIDVTGQVKRAPVDKDGKVATALVTNTGTVLADGGTVLLTASAVDGVVQTLVTAGGNISAPSVGGQTGRIAVRGTGGAVLVTGSVLAQGQQSGTTGGQVELNGTGAVTLASTARVDASGQAGGGAIAVGTTMARAVGGPSVTPKLTAAHVGVAAGATITADATGKGNGGRVTVLSTQSTNMAGAISGKGGPTGGDGGFVEVSGSTAFALTGPIDVSAPLGRLGNILLDPTNLTVVSGPGPVTIVLGSIMSTNYSADQDQALSDSGTLVASAANTPLNQVSNGAIGALTGNVELQATNDLHVTAPITLSNFGQGLTLRAGNNLTVDSGVAIATIAGTVVLAAGDPTIPGSNPAGKLVFNGALNTAGPTASGNASLSSGTGGTTLGGSLNVGTGTLTMAGGPIQESATAGITAGLLSSSGVVSGTVSLLGTNAISNLGPFTVGGPGNFYLTDNIPLNVSDPVSVSGNNSQLYLQSSGGITIGFSGAIQNPGSNATASFQTDSFNILRDITSSGFITSPNVELAPNTPNSTVTLGGTGSGLLLPDLTGITASTVRIGAISVPTTTGLTTTAGSIVVAGAFGTSGITLELNSNGVISGSGALTANTLTGRAAGFVDLSTATNAISNLGAFTAGGNFALNDGSTALQISGAFAGTGRTVTLTAGSLGIGAPVTAGALQFAVNGAVSQSAAINVGTLGGSAASIDLNAAGNIIGTLGSLQGQSNIAIATAGNIALNGAIATPDLHIDANGTITQTGGSLAVGTLSGSALHLADFTTNASVADLGAFTVTGSEFVLNNAGPLTITGPLSAQYIAITARDQVTLTGTIATLGLPLAQQSSPAGTAGPGSYITVLPGTTGTGIFTAASGATIVPLGGPTATLRIGVPGAGGQVALSGLAAPNASLILDVGDGGTASGTLDAAGLLVLGSHRGATLFGTVDGFGSFGAAFAAGIEPNVDPAYTINSCPIGSAACLLTQDALLALIAQVSAAANPAIAADNLSSKSVVAVPPLPAPFGGASDADSGDLVPPNISAVDY